jgi:hypothetical protein
MRGRVKIQLALSNQFCYLLYVIMKSEQISFDQVSHTLDSKLTANTRHIRTLNAQRHENDHLFCESHKGAKNIIFMAEGTNMSILSDDILIREFISCKSSIIKIRYQLSS